MPLSPGQRLGSYEVIAAIGSGGMGDVYRARDSRLGRDVALKILPDAFAGDADRLARFEREARALAALNHPNIAHIHGLEEGGTTRALVMELVPGRTLEELIYAHGYGPQSRAGGLPIGDALPIARQLADALEAAHEHGIVHRDLKPANIKVTDDGVVKVLDFGLAKAMLPDADDPVSGAVATRTSPVMTQAGLILGTAAYMSPEQARGKAVDRRADIWAFGVVLFEMLTGRRLFDGESVSDVVAAVLTRQIDAAELPDDVPPAVRALVMRCLQRDPKRRLRDVGEARIALESPNEPTVADPRATGIGAAIVPPVAAPRARSVVVPWIIAGLAALIAVGFAAQARRPANVSGAADHRLVVDLAPAPGTEVVAGSNAGAIVISPDGSNVVFLVQTASGRRLYVRSLDTGETRPLSGTEDAHYPFWSPDSKSIAFFGNSKLFTMRIAGGLPEAIADIQQGRGGSWSQAGFILFTPRGGGAIHRVPERGGTVETVTTLDASRGENAHYWPVALPGAKRFLYFIRSTRPENNGIYLGSLDGTTPAVRLVTSLSSGVYAPPVSGAAHGHLLWVRDDELLAQTLDVDNARLAGDVETIATDVRVEESQRGSFVSVSATGRLVWASARAGNLVLAWYDRSGRRLDTLPIDPGKVMQPRLSPDGTKLLFTRASKGTADIWLHDVASGSTSQVTSDVGYDESASWSADGRSLAHEGEVGGVSGVLVSRVNGSGRTPLLPNLSPAPENGRFMPDGRSVLVVHRTATESRIGLVAVDRPETVTWLVSDRGLLIQPAASFDGKWLAFVSERTGRPEVVVSRLVVENDAYKVIDQRLPVSNGGGTDPEWRADGREILYLSPDRTIMAVTVTTTADGIAFGKPAPLMRVAADAGGWGSNWAANDTHEKFVIVEAPNAASQTFKLMTKWR